MNRRVGGARAMVTLPGAEVVVAASPQEIPAKA
jgi:hypothetical protein